MADTRPLTDYLFWVDMEMSGLDPLEDEILEFAMIVSDSNLNEELASRNMVIGHDVSELKKRMDEWNLKHHAESGLLDEVARSELKLEQVEDEALEILGRYVEQGRALICGSSVHHDRRFISRHMPRLENFFHYRILDVSTIKELVTRWRPDLLQSDHRPRKEYKHRALDDIRETIAEMRFYRDHFLRLDGSEKSLS